jgi:DNA ligase-1
MKPQLAENWIEEKLTFPKLVQPKYDGVRACYLENFTGRSLKKFANKKLNERFSDPKYKGLDGELCVGSINSTSLCRDTTSTVNTINGELNGIKWYVFDYVTDASAMLPYKDRLEVARSLVKDLADPDVVVFPTDLVTSLEQVLGLDAQFLKDGFEGSILRNPNAPYKEGRSSKKVQELWRIKRFTEKEAIVIGIIEGRQNLNEATINELGRTERSSHAENQVPNGMVGTLTCIDVESGDTISVAAGALVHDERKHYFENPDEIMFKCIKYRTFEHGKKDLPRFPQYHSLRAECDMDATLRKRIEELLDNL